MMINSNLLLDLWRYSYCNALLVYIYIWLCCYVSLYQLLGIMFHLGVFLSIYTIHKWSYYMWNIFFKKVDHGKVFIALMGLDCLFMPPTHHFVLLVFALLRMYGHLKILCVQLLLHSLMYFVHIHTQWPIWHEDDSKVNPLHDFISIVLGKELFMGCIHVLQTHF